MAKETYSYGKQDPLMWQKSPTLMALGYCAGIFAAA
jgi:hypothetical protein